MRIEIIGGMGVGKTTLCHRLEKHGFFTIYETLEKNPYLELSYNEPETYGFYSQISFILGNFFTAVQKERKGGVTFFDFSTITDKAYTNMFLQGKARDIALQTINFLEEKEGRADLFLYLKCSPEEQLKRIRGRNRDYETGVNLDFVKKLDEHIQNYVEIADAEGSNILAIDTEKVDVRYDYKLLSSLSTELGEINSSYTSPKTIDQNSTNPDYKNSYLERMKGNVSSQKERTLAYAEM
jgi:deoxyadenosine/deoxycytidine kinase